MDLHLHNVLSEDDPYNILAQRFLEAQRDKQSEGGRGNDVDWKVALLRTCLLCFKARAPAMLQHFDEHGLLYTRDHLASFIMDYTGPVNDNATTETSTCSTPEALSLFVWSTFRATGRLGTLKEIMSHQCLAYAIAALETFPEFGGTGFSAATTLHTLADANRRARVFNFRNDGHRQAVVGPNPQKLINLLEGRKLHAHQYGGDDVWYGQKLSRLVSLVQRFIPAGPQGSLRRRLATFRTVQFNCCKLLICFQYLCSGKVGSHGRQIKDRPVITFGRATHSDSAKSSSDTEAEVPAAKRHRGPDAHLG